MVYNELRIEKDVVYMSSDIGLMDCVKVIMLYVYGFLEVVVIQNVGAIGHILTR